MSTYNSETTLERAINSILNQSYKRIEFLICNDGSTDNTKKFWINIPIYMTKLKLLIKICWFNKIFEFTNR